MNLNYHILTSSRAFYLEFSEAVDHFRKRRKLADITSSCSDLFLWIPHPDSLRKPETCYAALLACAMYAFNEISYEILFERVQKIAYFRNYQGGWKFFDPDTGLRYLESLKKPAPGKILRYSCFFYSTTQEFFGNFVKTFYWTARRARVTCPYFPSKSRVKYPQRKRGYDDKGTLPRFDSLKGIRYFRKPRERDLDLVKAEIQMITLPPSHFSHDLNEKTQAALLEMTTSQLE